MSEAKTLKSGIVQKTCQRCGKIFDCGATANSCECFSVNLPPEIVKQLQTNYGDCLCVSCLKDLNGKQKPKNFRRKSNRFRRTDFPPVLRNV
ncbi:cysteine-rich CWC family protein [Leptospira borgpetersenii]|uniref:cysteine-rich CWC family protein n=1 Tax=Leptospira borgpetersenii TaxID=174 RepID=UPI00077490A6|nr:cysteine-rich CWC family protein [Leptospira borgpetersenii]MBE8362741.1 cysteine-rich CWC family protein [Leptospira borgpetersenii serovar Balcanica]MBE8366872.1 cysteine-rich CWC family protein [Leptospira borgpetersenii serovar Balcanica]MBE8399278.1 cysteine-rich CWC family protein [Leptospira borgpetersenii serovar Tarassovi]MBE8402308.1 cysteine-rich CWC family protein [Leptospira borgpetersenii serovar Tarassovi]MBE8405457.1 cysteine-rich CWC family protein [Leptospira borgpeterseni